MSADPLAAVSDPQVIRQMIGQRAADLIILRRLLKIAESRRRHLDLLSIPPASPCTPAVTGPAPMPAEVAHG